MSNDKSLSICLFVIICLCAFSGCSKPKTSYEYLNQARQEHQKGDDQTALINLKNALKLDPKNGEARLLIARILNERGDGSSAEIEVRKAIQIGINKSYAAPVLGEALLLQKQYQKIVDTIKPANGDEGKVAADIYNVRGNAYLALNKIDEAKTAYEMALKEYSDSADAYLGMARVAEARNDLKGAMKQIDIALSKDPNSTMGWLLKADAFREQNNNEEAKAAYMHVLKIDQRNISAHLRLASMALVAGELDAAKAEVDAAEKISPKSINVRYAVAMIQFRRNKLQDALESIEAVIKDAPDNMLSILLHGAISLDQGSNEQAFQDVSRVLARYPRNDYARRLRAEAQLKLGKPEDALKTLQPLLKPELEDAHALALAGEAQLMTKNYSKATDYLQKAIEINPQAHKLQTQLALSYLSAGDTEKGMNELEKVAKQSPGQSQGDIFLIVTHIRLKQYDQALSAISNLEKKLKPNPVTYSLRGTALLGKHDYSDARKAFEQALAVQPTYFPAALYLAQLDLRNNKPDAARTRFERILEKDGNNSLAMMALADLAAHEKKENEYETWLEKAINANPNAVKPRTALTKYYLAKKENQKALALVKDAVHKYPDSLDALNLLGTTQLALGDKAGSISTFTLMIQKAPQSPTAFLNLARAQSADKQLGKARANLRHALELKPDFRQAQEALIRLELADKKPEAALQIARQIETQLPKSPIGFENEADILVIGKKYQQAIKAYEQALAKGGRSPVFIKLHRSLLLAGNKSAADQRLITWIKQNPKDIDVRLYAAEYYIRSNRNRDAIAQYEEALKLSPQNAQVLNNLADLYQTEKDPRALATAEQAFKLAPENDSVLDTLGWILMDQGQLGRAGDLLAKAVAKAPKNATFHYHYGAILARSGKTSQARKELEAAIAAGQKFPELDDAKTLLKSL